MNNYEVDFYLFLCNNNIDHDNTIEFRKAEKPSCISSWLYKGALI